MISYLLLTQLVDVLNISMGFNYGCDKVRFPGVVKEGNKVSGTGEIINVEVAKDSLQVITRVTIEVVD